MTLPKLEVMGMAWRSQFSKYLVGLRINDEQPIVLRACWRTLIASQSTPRLNLAGASLVFKGTATRFSGNEWKVHESRHSKAISEGVTPDSGISF